MSHPHLPPWFLNSWICVTTILTIFSSLISSVQICSILWIMFTLLYVTHFQNLCSLNPFKWLETSKLQLPQRCDTDKSVHLTILNNKHVWQKKNQKEDDRKYWRGWGATTTLTPHHWEYKLILSLLENKLMLTLKNLNAYLPKVLIFLLLKKNTP